MFDATFTGPDLTIFACLDDLGLVVVGQRVESDQAVLACRVVDPAALMRGSDRDDREWMVSVDSTSIRAHQHAAGARLASPVDVTAERLAVAFGTG